MTDARNGAARQVPFEASDAITCAPKRYTITAPRRLVLRAQLQLEFSADN